MFGKSKNENQKEEKKDGNLKRLFEEDMKDHSMPDKQREAMRERLFGGKER